IRGGHVTGVQTCALPIFDLSRIDAGTTLRSELVEAGAVLRSVVTEVQTRAAERGQAIELDDDAGVWAVGDPGSVAQILRILLDKIGRASCRERVWIAVRA